MNIYKIVFIRHGESLANIENRFSGWLDVDLTNKGYNEAYKAGLKLKKLNYKFNLCYTSMLKRAIKTAWSVLDGTNLIHIPIIKSFKLNERHYGDLSGLNKIEGLKKYGKNNIFSWLNKYDKCPPPINKYKYNNLYKKYKILNINKSKIPYCESLNDVLKRVLKIWNSILKKIKLKNILIVAHSNVLKILTKFIDKNADEKIELIPNTTPIIYEFDENLNKLRNYLI
ncbi:2,3-bisphosphoglycerate-dependent phosphoglycerate mutase [Candidatus Nasuia deltocephalinicola]|nr:2,3-bisphosphoglycerate-dependent phosphoglycerate mutase [Candidatus Nasuia deltocephalinicola]